MENEKSENQKNENSKLISLFIILMAFFFIIVFFILGPHHYHLSPRIICGTNMNAIGKAMMVYANDFDGYPTPEKWCDLLMEKCEVTLKTFHCKETIEGPCNYALNKYLAEITTANDPNIVVLFETNPGWNQVGGPEILTTQNHDGEGCNVVFLDGHVEFIKAEDISKLKWKPD